MYIRRDGSVQGPLWPQEIKDIVLTKFKQVHIYTPFSINTLATNGSCLCTCIGGWIRQRKFETGFTYRLYTGS